MKRFMQALGLLLVFPGAVLSAEKSVIIGFNPAPVVADGLPGGPGGSPGVAEETLVLPPTCTVLRRYQLIPAVAASVPEEEIAGLRANPAIAYVEENAIYTTAVAAEGDAEGNDSWQVAHIDADAAHAIGNLGTGVKVAVLDTGIDYTHAELLSSYRGGYDFVSDDADPFDDSRYSHGTHVAGIIAADKNGFGIVGVAPGAELYGVKVLHASGFGTEEWIIAGIEWAVINGADIINMSLAGPDRQGMREACEQARNAGVLLVAAGGNSLAGGGPVKYPAAYSSVIAVTGTDELNEPGWYAPRGDALELAAPGDNIYSTSAAGAYSTLSGTSQAAACVSGAAALFIQSLQTDLNGDQVVDNLDVRLMLQLTSQDLGQAGFDDAYGFGLVNALQTSYDSRTTWTITRPRSGDGVVVTEVADALYCITIANDGLSIILLDVYEGATLRDDLSDGFVFHRGRQQSRVMWLDATGTNYTLRFRPYGIRGRSAEIVLERVSE